ncbi:hypothetical protein LAZ67_13000785 [Cordylochernes scorpioides]|uniref:Uncharacterized protein n=1 Tax=Cordylochernes scorpioides TaxID=51811 RepID=A0ABY6L3A6_9ARAC|nr:hypothetical protein LAZ67_13000785 [Cordylochernes scorpioides]
MHLIKLAKLLGRFITDKPAIHQNKSLNPIDKFNYLKTYLGGTALNTVEGFALSADNYEKAIKLLKDRFGRGNILISRHMKNLLSMRPLKTSSDVRTFREPFDNLSVQMSRVTKRVH